MFDLYTDLELLARYKHEQALRHAEQQRLLQEALRARAWSTRARRPRPVARLAQAVGASLVALGTRLQAVSDEPRSAAPVFETCCGPGTIEPATR
jgi:hypothetical protein